jgi:hypothetical protein
MTKFCAGRALADVAGGAVDALLRGVPSRVALQAPSAKMSSALMAGWKRDGRKTFMRRSPVADRVAMQRWAIVDAHARQGKGTICVGPRDREVTIIPPLRAHRGWQEGVHQCSGKG